MPLHLQNSSRVGIIGGGPAGSFAAIHLLKLAQELGLQLEVLIFEPRDFGRPGLGSCKGCAGILSASLIRAMDSFGLSLPKEVIQSELRAYVVHIQDQVTSIEQPNPHRRIISVYRGGGPRLHAGKPLASFDGYLLAQACACGAKHIPTKVRSVEWDNGPVIQTALERFPSDLVVLASGVNSRAPLSPAFGYQPPKTVTMAQAEIVRPSNWPEYKVAGFFGGSSGLVFGAVVPKGRYLNVSLLWQDSATEAVQRFYETQAGALRRFFPTPPESMCSCTPRIVARPAPACFGDQWVAVGDAAISRLYKDGINSAFLTTGVAMRAALEQGIARQDFQRAYAPFCQRLATDNSYGEMMFRLSALAMRNPLLARACVGGIRTEASLALDRPIFSRLMWGMLTGDEPYRDLFWLALKPRGLISLGSEMLRAINR